MVKSESSFENVWPKGEYILLQSACLDATINSHAFMQKVFTQSPEFKQP